MIELFLNYEDENGEPQRVPVNKEKFVVGRHSDSDLSIPNSKLSRKHIEIQRFAEVFVVTDCGSSNGTELNENEILDPESLYDGDILNLGGGIEITVEVVSDNPNAPNNGQPPQPSGSDGNGDGGSANVNSDSSDAGTSMGTLLLIVPLVGIFLLLSIGGALYFFSGSRQPEVVKDDGDFIATSTPDDPEDPDTTDTEDPVGDPTVQPPVTTQTPEIIKEDLPPTTGTPIPEVTKSTPNPDRNENQTVERSAVSFMRRIARNDRSPVLTTRQIAVLKTRTNRYKGSAILASNIKNARSSASAIAALANSKNLKPQFLAGAALAKLGNSRGNVLVTAQGMVEVLDNLNIQIGDEVADDGLVTIAAYQQGVSGQFLQMRNTMERLASKNPSVSSRQIRTIWFLRDKGKLTNAEFEFALRFLAIGTITQNPKAFNVNTNALSL